MLTPPHPFLRVTKQGINLVELELRNQINIGLGFIQLIPGNVTFFEEHMIRQSIGYTIEEWDRLDRLDKAFEVAVYRLKKTIDNHFADEEIQRSKRNARKR